MPGDIGPGPLMCVLHATCTCGQGVKPGCLYQCIEIVELTIMQQLIYGPCACEERWHPYVRLQGHKHIYCPTCFTPLGDPDAEIKETDEPKLAAPVKSFTLEEFVKRFINV